MHKKNTHRGIMAKSTKLPLLSYSLLLHHVSLFFPFFDSFNVPFKIILLIETSQSIGGAKREYPG